MFNLFGAIKLLLRLTGTLAEWGKNRQLMSAGEAKAINKGLVDVYNTMERARHARDNIDVERLRAKYTRPPDIEDS
jgi:hypothetical protein|tara:strand:+ start:1466 stop:1693 length:228 start_codon:yes stop_codon:yes gene_type:complete